MSSRLPFEAKALRSSTLGVPATRRAATPLSRVGRGAPPEAKKAREQHNDSPEYD